MPKSKKQSELSFYIAGSYTERIKIRRLIKRVIDLGGTITLDWTTHPSIFPYTGNQDIATRFALEDLEGARKCQFFVMIPEKEGGSTQFTELGAAIFSEKVKRIFVVGESNDRSLSFFHPRVERMDSFDEVLKATGLISNE